MKEHMQICRAMFGTLRRRHVPIFLIFLCIDVLSIYLALVGDALFAVFILATTVMFVVFFWALSAGLIEEMLAGANEAKERWKREREYTQGLIVAHVDVMAELEEHDPMAAERHRERFAAKLMEQYPGLEAELAGLRERADWN